MLGHAYYRTTRGELLKMKDHFQSSHYIPCDKNIKEEEVNDAMPIVVYLHAEEGVHLMLEDHPKFHAMSSIMAGGKMCADCVGALKSHGVTGEHNMYEVAKKLSAIHLGLRPARF